MLHRVRQDVVPVRSHHGIAAGDDQDGVTELPDLIDQYPGLALGDSHRDQVGKGAPLYLILL